MAKARVTREELERDEVAEGLHDAAEWTAAHTRQLIIGILAVLIVLVIILSWRGWRERTAESTTLLLTEALSGYNSATTAMDDQARSQAFDTAENRLNDLIDRHGGTELGRQALFTKGTLYYNSGMYDQATTLFEEFIREAGSDAQRARGEIALAYANENQAFLTTDTQRQQTFVEQAAIHFERAQAQAEEGSWLETYARLGQARILELNGRNEQAAEIYEDIIASRPAPEFAVETDETGDNRWAMLRNQINENAQQLSFEATAKLRLDKLQARMNAPEPVAFPVPSAAAATPVATPAATPTATPAATPTPAPTPEAGAAPSTGTAQTTATQ